jgi:hypothetical protein
VLATLAQNLVACLFQGSDGLNMVDAGDLRHGQTATSISRTSSPRRESVTAAKYSWMAS